MTAYEPLELEILPPYIGSAVSPEVDITETTNDVTVTITDFRGEHSYTVEKTDQAIADAEQAATNANQAATQATATANAAAQYARTTAEQAAADAQATADEAAGRADAAAGNADAKAALADTAAANADTATANANTATTNATNAAQAANNAADVAIEAAEDMPRLIGTVDTAQTVNDAWETTMEGAAVYGKSVQNGTPTPSAPVPVQVVSGTIQLQTGETVHAIDLQGHTLAGLRNDVRDELTINAAGVKKIAQNVKPLDLSALTWQWQSTWACWYTDYFTDMATVPSGATDQSYLMCDTVLGNNANNIMSATYAGTGIAFTATGSIGSRIVCKNGSTTDTPTGMFYYPLAEPVTHELGTITLTELSNPCTLGIYASLDPEWAIEYTQDPSIVVNTLQSSIAPVEGSTASTNYAVGAYLMHANQLYRVTSAIATGEAITPGSNCVACTVMGEVIRLTA